MASYLTQDELEAIQTLDRSASYVIQGVSKGMLSIARHSKGITFRGFFYCYIPETDELVRGDVLDFVRKARKKKAKTQEPVNRQLEIE